MAKITYTVSMKLSYHINFLVHFTIPGDNFVTEKTAWHCGTSDLDIILVVHVHVHCTIKMISL